MLVQINKLCERFLQGEFCSYFPLLNRYYQKASKSNKCNLLIITKNKKGPNVNPCI